MTTLVTGGAGFIGSHLAEHLRDAGKSVRIVDDLSGGKRENIPAGTEFQEGDFSEANLGGVDLVYHLAAQVSVPKSVKFPLEANETNLGKTMKLIRRAVQAKVRRFVFASSSSVYGDLPGFPKKESADLRPLSPYAVTKMVGELYCAQAAHHWGMETVVFRFFNVYGPRQDPGSPYAAVIPIFLSRWQKGESLTIFGDGKQTRDFTYVKDVAEGLSCAADHPGAAGKVINLAGGNPVSVLDVIDTMEKVIGEKLPRSFAPPRSGEILYSYADPAMIRECLDFVPGTPLEEGLKATFQWFRSRER